MRVGTEKVICWMLFEIQFILSSHFFLHYKVSQKGQNVKCYVNNTKKLHD